MYRHCLIYLSIFLAACNNQGSSTTENSFLHNTHYAKIKLIKNLGTITLRIPNTYDTLLIWTALTDCVPCGTKKYRFQPKNLPIAKESGFLYLNTPQDSINQLTIYHDEYFEQNVRIHTTIEAIKQAHAKEIDALIEIKRLNTEYQIQQFIPWDTVENINNHYFSIIETNEFDSTNHQYNKSFKSKAYTDRYPIYLKYQLLTKNNDSVNISFFKNAEKLIRTVRIDQGK